MSKNERFNGYRRGGPVVVGETRIIGLSPTQLLALDSTPLELIPAPLANKAILVLSYQMFLDYNSVAYTGGGLQLNYTDVNGGLIATPASACYRASADYHLYAVPDNMAVIGVRIYPGEPVVLCDAATLADGNSNLYIRLQYQEVDLLGG